MGGFAWVTLVTNDSYSLGALVLAHALRRVRTKHDLAVLITPGVTAAMREKLSAVFSLVKEVNVLDSQDEANLALLARPELGITFTKLHCWRLTQYEKCVFIDADALVIRNCDELFEREELSAAPDVGWPDCFNSGVFVFKPSQQTFASLTAFATSKGSFDGGDQGLLNLYFSDWAHKDISKHLPFIYNMCSTASYSYLPAYKQFGSEIRIIHFIGSTKPWLQYFDTQTSLVHPSSDSQHLQSLLQLWWNIFCEDVHPQLSPVMAGIAGALAKITLGEARSPEQVALEEHMRRQSWEQGQIDYMGRDSFDNIWKKICTTLSIVPETQESTPKETIVADVKEKVSKSPVVTKTPLTEDEPAKEVSQDVAAECHLKKSPEESKKSSEKSIQEISSPAVETSQAPNKNEPILSVTSGAPQLCIKESGETSRQTSKQEQEEKPAIALGFTASPKDSKDKPELKLDVSSKKSCIRTVADSPVPIQVAESVLEADIKESVSEDIKPVTEEAISSISAPIQESISTVVETPLEPPPPAQSPSVEASPLMQPNGNGLDIGLHFINAPPRSIPPISAPEPAPVRRQASIPETESKKPTGTCSRSLVGTSSSEKTEAVESESCQLSSKVSLAENVVPEQVPKTTEEVTPEPKVEPAEIVIETKPPEDPQTSAIVPEEPAAKEQERTLPKELVIPGTPTIIEATPPTSPPLDVAGCLPEPVKPEKEKPEKKVIRKIVKKSSEEKSEESEAGEGKKITKKVVKKVVKKVKDTDDTGESSATGEKPKKVVKVIKKTTKVQNLDAEASVPDTPPPASSQTPVPPKRKVKPATAKSSKKTEQDPAATP
ncbi:titin isoform X4 [Cotesia glomerata]|uniref:titin isoform X4 n=1 Tax=Cotesia glomerata TaxID=32391 RepID=UPI001D005AEA|nr:titin isoform X4 [Cotesia glomerata]